MTTVISYLHEQCSVQDDAFDTPLLSYANAVLFGLKQLGVINTLVLITKDTLWTDLNLLKPEYLEIIKAILGMRVKLLFDATSTQSAILQDAIETMESRLVIDMDLTSNTPVVP